MFAKSTQLAHTKKKKTKKKKPETKNNFFKNKKNHTEQISIGLEFTNVEFHLRLGFS